jgi:SAM-dependent methyltransferase
MLNIGCGTTFHADWTNIDLVSHSPQVIAHDATKGLPFDSETFDVCYSSHVLEHLRKVEADLLIREQKRVLKPNGIIRVVVPDLETICRNYLYYLDEIVSGNRVHEFRYDYSLLELYDQTTRDTSGGELGKLWASGMIADMEFVVARHGKVATDAIQSLRQKKLVVKGGKAKKRVDRIFVKQRVSGWINKRRHLFVEMIVQLLLGNQGRNALHEGLFRNSGQIHRVMYDQCSIKRLLLSHGFADVQICQADQSRIPDFSKYELDIVDGAIRKPDSLFVEAIRL